MRTNLRSVAAALLLAALAPALRAGITDNLVGYWDFDDGVGNVLLDHSIHGNNGALLNFPLDDSQWVPGQMGGALQLNAALSQFVQVPSYPKPTTTMSISAWVWADSNPGWASIAKNWAGGSSEFHFGLYGGSGELDNWIGQSDGGQAHVYETSPLPLGRWQHVAFVCDGSWVRLYRNGSQISAAAYNGTIKADPTKPCFGIGGNPYDCSISSPNAWSFWQGKIDDLGMWDRPLNPNEVASVFLAGLSSRPLANADAPATANVEVLNDEGQFGFPRFLRAANASSKGWFFGRSDRIPPIPSSEVLNGATLVANVGVEDPASGLTWNTAPDTYDIVGFAWTDADQRAARDGMSMGGIWQNNRNFSMKLAATQGKTYVVEILSLQGEGNRSMSVSVDDRMVFPDWTVYPASGYNRVLRLKVVADADGIDLTFWPGSAPDTDINPAISAVALTEWTPGVVTDDTSYGFPALAIAGNASTRAWNLGDAASVVLNGVTFHGNTGVDDPVTGLTFVSPPGVYYPGYGWGGPDQADARTALTQAGLWNNPGDVAMKITATPGQTYLLEYLGATVDYYRSMDLIVDGVTVVDEMRIYGGWPWNRVVRYQFTADADGIDVHIGHGNSAGADGNPIILALAVTQMSSAPDWVTQPPGATRWQGESVTLSGLASASLPITYEWYKEGQTAPVGSGNSLAFNNLSAAAAGNYTLVATTSGGSITSAPAALVVLAISDVTDGLIGYWNFDEVTGNTLHDSSLYGNNGALQNYPDDSQRVEGRMGGALAFDGISQYVLVSDYPKATTRMTISAWVWAESRPTWATIVKNWADAPHSHFHYGLTADRGDISNYIKQNGADYGLWEETPIPLGSWQHVAVVLDGATERLYRNGVQVAQTPYDGTIALPIQNALGIGASVSAGPPVQFWHGKIDDLAMWERGLTPDEITAIYAAGLQGLAMPEAGTPHIITNPQGATRYEHESLVLSVTAGGLPPLHYQWLSNDVEVLDATNSTLVLTDLAPTLGDTYTVQINNGLGNAPGAPAVVVVQPVDFLTTALGGYWPFDDGAGTTLTDLSAYGNNGTLYNFPVDDSAWVPGRIGGALQFRGLTGQDYIVVPNYPKSSSTLTLSAWAWADGRPTWATIAKNWYEAGSTHFHFGLSAGGGELNNYVRQRGLDYGLSEPEVFPLGSWQHVAVVLDGTAEKLYRNGVLVSQTNYDGTLPLPINESFSIGGKLASFGVDSPWQGYLDDLGLWTRGLSSEEITAIYRAGTNGFSLDQAILNPVPPEITQQPVSQLNVAPGSTVILTVAATGTPEPLYQWRFNGLDMLGENGTSLTLTDVQIGREGDYDVVVRNPGGTLISDPAKVTVLRGPDYNVVTIHMSGDKPVLGFLGDPLQLYKVLRTLSLSPEDWREVGQRQADAQGRIEFTDEDPPAEGAFYRVAPQ